jgi:hypothetical protein
MLLPNGGLMSINMMGDHSAHLKGRGFAHDITSIIGFFN